MKRDCYCNQVGSDRIGQKLSLCGWVAKRRDHGGVIFVDLRDRTGIVQVVFSPERDGVVHEAAHALRSEFVIAVTGTVVPRPAETENPNLATGAIEVLADSLTVLNPSDPLPFQLDEEVGENVRLQYRFLDLRTPAMQKNLMLRHRIMQTARQYLDEQGFLELETPMLTRSTPEGARDYLVPSRVNPGRFFALPQSPQLFKQLFMVAGFDRYFQITRCFRDEDLRADRQPEFTQIDLEASFVEAEDVMTLTEGMVAKLFEVALGRPLPLPLPRMTYAEAMNRYGLDAPDLRVRLELRDMTEVLRQSTFQVFAQAVAKEGIGHHKGVVKVLRVPGGATLTRKQIDEYTEFVGRYGAKGLAWIKINGPYGQEGGWQSPIAKFLSDTEKEGILAVTGAEVGDILFFGADSTKVVNEALGRLRVKLGRDLGLVDPVDFSFVWITDFPLLEWDLEAKRFTAVHHPFTSPRPEDVAALEQDPASVRARAYDLVLNGSEVGGGSIRIHSPEFQKKFFAHLGIGEEEAQEKFGFLLAALRFGAPPHGGLALGLDRLTAIMAGVDSIRDVIAFPKTQKATCLLTQAPSEVEVAQHQELHLRVVMPRVVAKE